MDTILLLAGAGFLLLLTEMFLPGGVLGALGGLLLAVAIVMGYMQLGPVGGSLLFVGIAAGVLVGFCVWMAVFPRTAVGRKLMLGRSLGSGAELAPRSFKVGDEGQAATLLRPAGTALVGGRRVDVVADGEYIEAGAAVVIVACEGARIAVRRKA